MAVVGSTEIRVENFKSLRNFQIVLDNFNVLIGINGSGKTNILELFKFANMCIDSPKIPAYPFRAWSGFKNIVWSHDIDLPIRICAKHSTGKYDIEYVATISDSDGRPEYLDEKLAISNYLSVTRSLTEAKFKINPKFLETIKAVLDDDTDPRTDLLANTPTEAWTSELQQNKSILPLIQQSPFDFSTVLPRTKMMRASTSSQSTHYGPSDIYFFHLHLTPKDRIFIVPTVKISNDGGAESFIHTHAASFFAGRRPMILLRQLNYAALREAPSIESSTELGEDGMGLVNILFRWYNSHTGLPDRITLALESLFPEWQISFTVTDDGRILLNVHDGNVVLHPPSIPDGFYRLLAILTAIELNPKFLLIDEIETSLHAKMIEYVMGELRDCDPNVVITTHSPAVIDAVRLEDLVLLERTNAGTTSRRVDNPEGLRKKLSDLGVTASEGWLYGKL